MRGVYTYRYEGIIRLASKEVCEFRRIDLPEEIL